MAKVNNVTRMLDSRKIKYTAYELPPEKLGALESAELLGVEPSVVFKTIVLTREKHDRPILVVLPGTVEVDLKLVAIALGEKKVHLPSEREAESITGLQSGGISPLALINRGFQTVIDVSARDYSAIHVSGGQRGLNIKLPVADLVILTKAVFAVVSRPIRNI